MSSHALLNGPTARRPRVALGVAAAALLLLTAACEETKEIACKSSAALEGMFGTEPSAERMQDCGPMAGQAARSSAKQAARPAGPQTDRRTVADVQARLKDLGYDPGPADGQMGPKTRAAIRAYQRDEGLRADGLITASLVERIRAE